MLNVLSNLELERLTPQDSSLDGGGPDALPELALSGVAGYITKCWEAARTTKQTLVKNRLLEAQRMRRGEYDPQKLAEIQKIGGSEEYGRIVSNKCRIAEAWLRDVYLGQAEPPWALDPTPVPALTPDHMAEVYQQLQAEILDVVGRFGTSPPEDILIARRNELADAVRMRIRDQAKDAVERMAAKMEDQLVQGGFRTEWADFLNDVVTYPAAHFKGPVYKKCTQLEWKRKGGRWAPKAEFEIVPTWYRIDPFRAYPSPGAVTPQDGYFIEHITLQRNDLYDMIGAAGYSEKEIRAVLEEAEYSGLTNWLGLTDSDQNDIERGDTNYYLSPQAEIDALEFNGPIQGNYLLDWGMPKRFVPDDDKDYEVTAWLIGRHVVKIQINPDPLGRRPIYKECWEEVPGEYWGQGLPDGLRDINGICNAAIRSLVNNMAMASGPQVAINTSRLPAGMDIESLTPWKLWQFISNEYATNEKAIEFFQPQINASEIIGVLDKFYSYADDWSLIPRYMGGSDNISGGVGRTASGMSMLFNAANKGLKGVVSNIDIRVLTPLLSLLYAHNMLLDKDDTIKGDAQVVAKGAVALLQLETLQLRRNEFLQTTLANPVATQIVGEEGIRTVYREVAKGLDMDVNKIIPKNPPTQGAQPMPGGPGQVPSGQANQEVLPTGQAVTDNFSPNNLRSPV